MKKTIILLMTSLALITSCTMKERNTPKNRKGENCRFLVIYEQSSFGEGALIIQDTKTKNKYLFYKCGYGAGLTKLDE